MNPMFSSDFFDENMVLTAPHINAFFENARKTSAQVSMQIVNYNGKINNFTNVEFVSIEEVIYYKKLSNHMNTELDGFLISASVCSSKGNDEFLRAKMSISTGNDAFLRAKMLIPHELLIIKVIDTTDILNRSPACTRYIEIHSIDRICYGKLTCFPDNSELHVLELHGKKSRFASYDMSIKISACI